MKTHVAFFNGNYQHMKKVSNSPQNGIGCLTEEELPTSVGEEGKQ